MKKSESLTTRAVTPARRAANRASAALSTGPKSKRGKETVTGNAVTHGIFARAVLVHDETAEEFAAFAGPLRDALAPEDDFEVVLVEKIAVALWRSRRLLRFERGQIQLGLFLMDANGKPNTPIEGRAERKLLLDEGTLKRMLKYGSALEKEWIRAYVLLMKRREARDEDVRP